VRRRVGVVGQRHGLDPAATGRENLVLQGALYDLPRRELKARTADMLARFRLLEAADRAARTYSGGMQRKLDLALGLLHRPEVLFLDEPTTGLDPEARADLWEEIARLAREEAMTILLTTHYLEEADRLAAGLAIVDGGRVVAAGSPDELKADLHGDTLQIEMTEELSPPAVVTALERVGGVSAVRVDGRTVRARARDGAAAMPEALAALGSLEQRVTSVTVARPTLDDVYLRYAGRTFEEAA
jgi:ABC-2 type transport system ATP-binding protein